MIRSIPTTPCGPPKPRKAVCGACTRQRASLAAGGGWREEDGASWLGSGRLGVAEAAGGAPAAGAVRLLQYNVFRMVERGASELVGSWLDARGDEVDGAVFDDDDAHDDDDALGTAAARKAARAASASAARGRTAASCSTAVACGKMAAQRA